GGEGKVMGLAPYGEPERYYRAMCDLLHWTEDGRFHLELEYFDYHVTGWTHWVSPAFEKLFGPRREPESELTAPYQDIAAALQRVVEEAALAQVRHLHRLVPSRNLCLAGGVALNSVMTGRIVREGPFENVFIQPAANDAGTALGGALFLAHGSHGAARSGPTEVAYLGPEHPSAAVGAAGRRSALVVEGLEPFDERPAARLAPRSRCWPPARFVVTIVGSISGVEPAAAGTANSNDCRRSPFSMPLIRSAIGVIPIRKRINLQLTLLMPLSKLVSGLAPMI